MAFLVPPLGGWEPDMRPEPSAVSETLPPDLLGERDGRLDVVCIRPPGPFKAFDDRLTQQALHFARFIRVPIVRSWDFAAQHDWVGFVSRSVPTVLLVRAGRVIVKSVGDLPNLELRELIRAGVH